MSRNVHHFSSSDITLFCYDLLLLLIKSNIFRIQFLSLKTTYLNYVLKEQSAFHQNTSFLLKEEAELFPLLLCIIKLYKPSWDRIKTCRMIVLNCILTTIYRKSIICKSSITRTPYNNIVFVISNYI